MKFLKFAAVIVALLPLLSFQAEGWTVKIVFEQGFTDQFMPDSAWANVDSNDVKALIIDRVTEDFDPANISVSTSSGDVTVKIGAYGRTDFGYAETGLGSYILGNAYANVYCYNFAQKFEWSGNNATIERIAEGIARVASHEAGHLFNLYHAYMFDSYDPTLPGALWATLPSPWTGSLYSPVTIGWFVDEEGFCGECNDDPDTEYHLMSIPEPLYLTYGQMATINGYFSENSSQVLNFVVSGGGSVTKNMVWGFGEWQMIDQEYDLLNDVTISSGKTLIIGNNGYIHNLNGRKMTGTIWNFGTIVPEIGVRNEAITGVFSTTTDAFNYAGTGDTVFVETGSTSLGDTTTAVTIQAAVTQHDSIKLSWNAAGGAGHYFVRYGRDSLNYDQFLALKNTYTTMDIAALTNDSTYYFKVNGSSFTFTNIPRYCRTDYDGLGTVDFEDFLLFAAAWGKSEGQGGYEQRFDLSGNRVVDEPDSAIFVGDYGKTCAQLPKPVMPLLALGKNREAQPHLSVLESGNEVHVDVLLNHATALAGYEAALGYDAAALEYINIVDEGGLLHQQGEDAVFGFVKQDRGSLLIVAALKTGHDAATGSGSLTRIAFRKRGALTDIPVWLDGLKVADDDDVVDHLMANDETAQTLEESENLWITSLGQNTPNPFNPATAISFTLSNAGAVNLVIYNALGQEVRRLLSGAHLPAGSHQVIWDGRDALGRAVSSGIYMYRMKTDGFDAVQRMVMLK